MTVRKSKTAQKSTPIKKEASSLLAAHEPPPFRIENARGRGKCLVICDHASNRVPQALNNLGLTQAQLKKHIAWDPGTEDIGRMVSAALDAPAIFANYSRLVVDLNRGASTRECILAVSDHIAIPANSGLSRAARRARISEFFEPYHDAVDACIRRFLDKGITPVIISVHSFTPKIEGKKRPWHMGILWNREEEIADRLVDNLQQENPRLVIGANAPYSLKQANLSKNTIGTHAESRGLPYIIVEFRQDLVNTPEKAAKWVDIFLRALAPILQDPALYQLRHKRQSHKK